MLALYLASLGFGVTVLGLLLAMGGGKDADHGGADGGGDHGDVDHGGVDAVGDHGDVDQADADADVDHGGDVGAHAGGPDGAHAPGARGDLLRMGPARALLSVRFWTFFAAAFGGTGTFATLLGVQAALTLVAALATGVAVGGGAHALFRTLQHDRVSGDTDLRGLAGEEGTVTVAVRPGARGLVRVRRPSGTVDLVATTKDATALEPGAKVLVAEVRDGVADVTSARPAPRRGAVQQPRDAERP